MPTMFCNKKIIGMKGAENNKRYGQKLQLTLKNYKKIVRDRAMDLETCGGCNDCEYVFGPLDMGI